jgi:hypothetical protein
MASVNEIARRIIGEPSVTVRCTQTVGLHHLFCTPHFLASFKALFREPIKRTAFAGSVLDKGLCFYRQSGTQGGINGNPLENITLGVRPANPGHVASGRCEQCKRRCVIAFSILFQAEPGGQTSFR